MLRSWVRRNLGCNVPSSSVICLQPCLWLAQGMNLPGNHHHWILKIWLRQNGSTWCACHALLLLVQGIFCLHALLISFQIILFYVFWVLIILNAYSLPTVSWSLWSSFLGMGGYFLTKCITNVEICSLWHDSLPGRTMGEGHHVWLYGANEANTKVFNRALLAKVSYSPDLFFGFYTHWYMIVEEPRERIQYGTQLNAGNLWPAQWSMIRNFGKSFESCRLKFVVDGLRYCSIVDQPH